MSLVSNCGKVKVVQSPNRTEENIEIQTREHRSLDPRTKLVILILVNIIAISLSSSNLRVEIISMVLIGSTLIWQGMYKTCLKYWGIYAGMIALFILSSQYQNIVTAMFVVVFIVMRKTAPIFMFASSVVSKTKVSELIVALQNINLPRSIIIALSVTIRFFPTLKEECALVLDAMKMRGIKISFRNVFLHPMILVESIIVPIIIRTSTIAEELSAAAVTRGIDSPKPRTSYYEVGFGLADGIFLALFLTLCIVSVFIGG